MLTCATIDADKAKSYFLKDNYLEDNSRWFGEGAERWGLQGAITNEEAFKNLCDGKSPGGRKKLFSRLIKPRIAAIDCTFNAPKSISLTALVAEDERLINAHHKAVNKTLRLIEERYSHTRIQQGSRKMVTTGNLIVAQFDHIDARRIEDKHLDNQAFQAIPDPHLHTHCLIFNATEVEKGKWYAHASDGIFSNKKLLGMMYQHYLAMEVQKLGYEVEPREHGQFDIKGYSREDLMSFSKRRQKILEIAGTQAGRYKTEKVRKLTRAWKTPIIPEDLKQQWKEEAAKLGITFVVPQTPIETKVFLDNAVNLDNAVYLDKMVYLDKAIAYCSEQTRTFKPEDIEKFVLSQGVPIDITQISATIPHHPELIEVPDPIKYTTKSEQIKVAAAVRYTTQYALEREKETIELMRQGRGKMEAVASKKQVNQSLKDQSLTPGQLEAIELSLTTTDQFIAWQGFDSEEMTCAIAKITELAQQQNYSVQGIAPNDEAAKEFTEAVGVEVETVDNLLSSKPPDPVDSQSQLWIAQDAGRLSAKNIHDLMEAASHSQAWVIFVADTQQLLSTDRENPFKSLQQAGMKTVNLNPSGKYRTPQIKVTIDLIATGDMALGLARLDENDGIFEVGKDEKVRQIVQDYLSMSAKERDNTLILAGTNQERLEIIQGIRDGLKLEGTLGKTVVLTQLKGKDLTPIQLKSINHLDVGDILMPTKHYKRRGLEKGSFYEITEKKDDKVTLKHKQGNVITVDVGFEKAVYSQTPMEIAVGDRVQWSKTDRTIGRKNGQIIDVVNLEGNTATLEYGDGNCEYIDLSTPQHLDYALVSLSYSENDNKIDNALISADSTINKESFYAAVTKIRHQLKLYTSDKAKLLKLALSARGQENAVVHKSGKESVKQMTPSRPLTQDSLDEVTQSCPLSQDIFTQIQLNKSLNKENSPFNPSNQDKPTDDAAFLFKNLKTEDSLPSQKAHQSIAQHGNFDPNDTPFNKTPEELKEYKARLRLRYLTLAEQVREKSGGQVHNLRSLDQAIAHLVYQQTRDENRVSEVLTLSEQACRWKESMKNEDYQRRLTQYINEITEETKKLLNRNVEWALD